MTLYVSNRDGDGKTDEKGHYKFPSNAFVGSVVMPGLAVTQNSPLGMSVLVDTGDFRIDTGDGYAYTGWSSISTPVTIGTADPANPRIDSVVIYIDKGAATSPSPPNNPGIPKFMVVAGTPGAIPSAPSGGTIQAAVGASNPYIILANVTVAAAATQIVNANISDQRVRVTIANDFVVESSIQDSAITTNKIANLAVTTGKIADSNVTTAKIANANVTPSKLLLDYVLGSATGTSSATSTTYVNSNVSVTLPTQGTWLIMAQIRMVCAAAGNYAVTRLVNSTTSTVISLSERIFYNTGTNGRDTIPTMLAVTTTGNNQIIRIQHRSGGAYTTTVEHDTNGYSQIQAIRIG